MADEAKSPAARPCAVCGKPVEAGSRFRPFCSARCRQVDLGRWLAGDYAIPGGAPEISDDDETAG